MLDENGKETILSKPMQVILKISSYFDSFEESFEIKETKTHYYFTITGISFLRYMVRSIMGTIIAVATDKMSIEVIDEIFETKNRMLAGKTAEAKGLYFKKVIY